MCFLRPTRENIARLRKELRSQRYGEYHLCKTLFSCDLFWKAVQEPLLCDVCRECCLVTDCDRLLDQVKEGALKKACCAVFTNRIEDLRLQDLAEVDLREVIYQVQEFFGDFTVLDPHHFAVPIQQNQVTLQPFTWDYGRRYACRLL